MHSHKYVCVYPYVCDFVKQVTGDLLPALEEHLKDLESGKKTAGSSPAV